MHGKRFNSNLSSRLKFCSKFIMEHYWEKVSFSRSRKHKPTKLSRLQNVTWKHILGLLEQFRQNCISLSVHSILLNKKHCLKCFRNLFEITHTDFFYSWIFLLPYMVNLEIGISFSITDLVCIKFMLYQFSFFFLVDHFHVNIDYLNKHIQPNFNLLTKTGVIFISIRSW